MILHISFALAVLIAFTSASVVTASWSPYGPGETSGPLELEVGASANISCRMNPDVFPGRNASHLHFYVTRSDEPVPKHDIAIINDTTIVYMLRNASQKQTAYVCKCDGAGIMETKVYVGRKPQPVKDFECHSYDFDYMVCNFTQPYNPVLTQYNLTFHTHSKDYKNEIQACNYDEKQLVVCNVTLAQKYRAQVENYHFTLIAANGLGKNVQEFSINNFEIMIPAAPGKDLRVLMLSANELKLSWRMPKYESYRVKGLQWEVLLTPDGFPVSNLSKEVLIQRSGNECHLRLKRLRFAYYWYELQIRVRVLRAPAPQWSAPFHYRFRTLARLPDRAPRTNEGSFYVNSSETHVRLYWEQLQPYEQNGQNFTYVISEVRRNGSIVQMSPLHFEANSAIFSWQQNAHYEFIIRSHNHLGDSRDFSRIEIFPWTVNNRKSHTPRSIHNLYNATNRTYTLSWQAPDSTENLRNYTVYWCYSKRALQNECKGSIHFVQLGADVHKFTTEPQSASQEHSLNLAVSANYDAYNTGMHWTACSIDVNSDLIKMELDVHALSATSIRVQWSPESICPSILLGYNLSYCETNDNRTCVQTQFVIIEQNARKCDLAGLNAYKSYRIHMYMFSQLKVGKASEPFYVRTLEAAPLPPRELELLHKTNISATIAWLPPIESNGIIRSYIIVWKSGNISEAVTTENVNVFASGKIEYELTNLNSSTEYIVHVIAKTVENSSPSNNIEFTTFTGIPSTPGRAAKMPGDSNNILRWNAPTMKNGRVDFYQVIVMQKSNDNVVVRQRISNVVGETWCAYNTPNCIDPNYKTEIEVRAVNAALLTNETDEHTALQFSADEFKSSNNGYDESDDDSLLCLGDKKQNDIAVATLQNYIDSTKYRLIWSDWQPSLSLQCPYNLSNNMTVLPLLAILISLCVMAALYMARKQYNKMANIGCTLPHGLARDNLAIDFVMAHKNTEYDNENDSANFTHGGKQFVFPNEKHLLLATMAENDNNIRFSMQPAEPMTTTDDCGSNMLLHTRSLADSSETLVAAPLPSAYVDAATLAKENAEEIARIESRNDQMKNVNAYIKPAYLFDWQAHERGEVDNLERQKSATEHEISTQSGSSGYVSVEDSLNATTPNISMQNDCLHATQLAKLRCVPAITAVPATPQLQCNGYTTLEELENAGTAAQRNCSGYTTLEALENMSNTADQQQQQQQRYNVALVDADTCEDAICGYVTQRELNDFGRNQNFN